MNIDTIYLSKELEQLRLYKRKLVKEIDDIDTKIIGLRLKLEKVKELERYQTEQENSKDR